VRELLLEPVRELFLACSRLRHRGLERLLELRARRRTRLGVRREPLALPFEVGERRAQEVGLAAQLIDSRRLALAFAAYPRELLVALGEPRAEPLLASAGLL
jgi:hypothetical protein